MEDKKVKKYRDWSEFRTDNSVGIITTLLSEQFLEYSFNAKPLTFENYVEEIELYDIDTVFIDNELYEIDHAWYKKSRINIVKYLNENNINLVVLKNTTHPVSKVFKYAFQLNINPQADNYYVSNSRLNVPIVLDIEKYNPINSQKNKDIIYFNVGKLIASKEIKSYNKETDPDFSIVSEESLSRKILLKLFSFIKKAKILYICETSKIDEIVLNYIEKIAFLNSTYVIFDYSFGYNPEHGYNSKDDKNNVSKLRILVNNNTYSLKQALYGQRQVMKSNTFLLKENLFTFLKSKSEIKIKPEISVITSTNRKNKLNYYLDQMNKQKEVTLEINLVTHGFQLTPEEQKAYQEKSVHPLNIMYVTAKKTLGECLNKCLDSSTKPVIAKVDDDDMYLDYYLFDQWLALMYSDSEVVGKTDGFYYFEADDIVARRNIDRYYTFDTFIMGATIMAKAEIIKKLKFSNIPKAVDSDFLRKLNEIGGKVYIGHPFEMCVYRDVNVDSHTWKVDDLTMLKSAEIVSFGNPVSYISLNQNS